jgi:Tetracyclin repressor-like, C-terminal domain
MDAVSERWVNTLETTLQAICAKDKDPIAKIHEWFSKLHRMKRERLLNDPELYRSFNAAAQEHKPVYADHLIRMRRQLTALVQEAVAQNQLTKYPLQKTVELLFETTAGFYNLKLVAQHIHEKREPILKQVLDVVIGGLG